MKWSAALLTLTLCSGLGRADAHAAATQSSALVVTFDLNIAPLLAARCQPCHFPGGKVYSKLPFDRSETLRRLGTKVFTRIKDEKSQALIRAFLATEPSAPPNPVPSPPRSQP